MKAPCYAERSLAVGDGGTWRLVPLLGSGPFDMVATAVARKNGLSSEPRLHCLLALHPCLHPSPGKWVLLHSSVYRELKPDPGRAGRGALGKALVERRCPSMLSSRCIPLLPQHLVL